MDYFPIFLSLKGRKISVIGGGEVACRKVDLLLKADADITVTSPELHPHLERLEQAGKIHWNNDVYQPSVLDHADQVWVTTNNRALNQSIYFDAEARGIWANVVDDRQYCHFITPSIIDRSPIQVAVSSGGASPVLVRFLREKLETQLPQNLSLLADYAGKQRDRIKEHFKTVDERRKFWEIFFRHPQVELANGEHELDEVFTTLLCETAPSGGALYLIETGDDPELLTLKALRLMQQSEFVLFPGEAEDIFVDLCRRDADRAPYDEQSLFNQVEKHLSDGFRVCVLANKVDAEKVFRPLKTLTVAQHIPCL